MVPGMSPLHEIWRGYHCERSRNIPTIKSGVATWCDELISHSSVREARAYKKRAHTTSAAHTKMSAYSKCCTAHTEMCAYQKCCLRIQNRAHTNTRAYKNELLQKNVTNKTRCAYKNVRIQNVRTQKCSTAHAKTNTLMQKRARAKVLPAHKKTPS